MATARALGKVDTFPVSTMARLAVSQVRLSLSLSDVQDIENPAPKASCRKIDPSGFTATRCDDE